MALDILGIQPHSPEPSVCALQEEVLPPSRGISLEPEINIVMKIDKELLDALTEKAKASPRLRMNLDMRTSLEDSSQRMLNALEPGTVLPIHRHRKTTETVVILRGSATQYFYDDEGQVTEQLTITSGTPDCGMSVETGRWHRMESHESGTVIFEAKDGPYEPISEEDIL